MNSGLGHRASGRDLQVEENSNPGSGATGREKTGICTGEIKKEGLERARPQPVWLNWLERHPLRERLWAGSLVWVHTILVWASTRGKQLMLLTCIDVSLFLFLSLKGNGGKMCKIWPKL